MFVDYLSKATTNPKVITTRTGKSIMSKIVSIDNVPMSDLTTDDRNEYIRNLVVEDTFINTKGIAELAGVSSASVVNWQTKLSAKEVAFPAPVPVSGGTKIWFTAEVNVWLENRGNKESRKREERIVRLMAELAAAQAEQGE